MMLAVWGDFQIQEIIPKIEQAFSNWERVDAVPVNMPEVHYAFRSTVNQIQKDDINQSNVFLGHIGGMKNDPDYFALIVANEILGAPFTGRLFKNVRSRQGLAYSTFGHYSANYTYPGLFYVGCQTKSASTVKAIGAMLNEVRQMTLSEVTDEELAIAKESFLNAFVFHFDTQGEIIGRLMTYAYYDYPADFLQQIKENVEKVTKQDVLHVARKHFKPDAMQILVVGRTQDFDEPLSALGNVQEIDITIPEPDSRNK
jgi:predicted Zn-dependent peptidase